MISFARNCNNGVSSNNNCEKPKMEPQGTEECAYLRGVQDVEVSGRGGAGLEKEHLR
jgi:hypothetical protein